MEKDISMQILEALIGVNTRLDKMDTRLDKIDTRLDGMDVRLDSIEARLDSVEGDLKSVKLRLDNLEQNVSDIRAAQAKDSNLLRIVFENSIELTERITGHDIKFEEISA